MNKDARCGICGLEQNSAVQTVIPIVTVADGNTIYRCGEHLNVPAREGEEEKYYAE